MKPVRTERDAFWNQPRSPYTLADFFPVPPGEPATDVEMSEFYAGFPQQPAPTESELADMAARFPADDVPF